MENERQQEIVKRLERSLKEVDPRWSVEQVSKSFIYCFYADVKLIEITDYSRATFANFTRRFSSTSIDAIQAALPVIRDFITPDDEKFFQPETTQDTCTYCHTFRGMHRAIGGAHYDDDSELSVYMRGHKLKLEYNPTSLDSTDIDVEFDVDYCPKCGRKLK